MYAPQFSTGQTPVPPQTTESLLSRAPRSWEPLAYDVPVADIIRLVRAGEIETRPQGTSMRLLWRRTPAEGPDNSTLASMARVICPGELPDRIYAEATYIHGKLMVPGAPVWTHWLIEAQVMIDRLDRYNLTLAQRPRG